MTHLPGDRRYTRAHEWAMESDGRILVGITDYAQDQLGDIVYLGPVSYTHLTLPTTPYV